MFKVKEPKNYQITEKTTLTAAEISAVKELLVAAQQHDKVAPFGEATVLALTAARADANTGETEAPARQELAAASGSGHLDLPVYRRLSSQPQLWLLAYEDSHSTCGDNTGQGSAPGLAPAGKPGELLGAMALNTETRSAEMVVAPAQRRQGVGSALLRCARQILRATPHIWAHGSLQCAKNFAESNLLNIVRTLHVMQRDITSDDLDPVNFPAGITVRTLTDSPADAELWVKTNHLIFRNHPEQGRLDLNDYYQRRAQEWFRPEQLFFFERDGEPIGYLWNKIPVWNNPASYQTGEVYALGIIPAVQGAGLGRYIMRWAVYQLAQANCKSVQLYVDSRNLAAMNTYENAGLRIISSDYQMG